MHLDAVVDPVGALWEQSRIAERPASLNHAPIALVDSMVNAKSGWGPGILDAAEQEIRARFRDATFSRVMRPQIGGPPAEIWAKGMAKRYAALVATVGD